MSGRPGTPRAAGALPRWSPSPLLYASAAVHLGAATAVLVRPPLWPWALGAVALNHVALAAAGLWPRSQLLGPNWTRLPPQDGAQGRVAITIDDGPDPDVPNHHHARSHADAPDIDCLVRVKGKGVRPGDIVRIKVTGADGYDLVGRTIAPGR